jgi:hypothetical protein
MGMTYELQGTLPTVRTLTAEDYAFIDACATPYEPMPTVSAADMAVAL